MPAPRLLGSHDNGDRVALVLADVEGRHPRTPWDSGEPEAVLRMFDGFQRAQGDALISWLARGC
jgi:hypothetical protein